MSNKVSFILLLLTVFLSSSIYSQSPKYSKVKIYTGKEGLLKLSEAGVTVDHGERKQGEYFISDFSASELSVIRTLGFKTEVLIDDVVSYYERRCKEKQSSVPTLQNLSCPVLQTFPVPAGFTYGSMGGYPTLEEIISTLDTLATLYPNLVKAKAPINSSTSIEGRPLYWTRISNNPNSLQTKPRILYTALHHAREPASVSEMFYYMFYLCENYTKDPEVKFLVDNTEMYFVPCINPDGYLYNQSTNPGGGGMWRKNRRNNMDGTYGVDLNRNYGFDWGYDNIGSSPTTSSDTYRGTAAFSEPETMMMKYIDSVFHFRVTVNYHTYGNDLIYPWGYSPGIYTPDSALFVQFAGLMTDQNHFARGTGNQTVGYVVNGDSDDWAYGDTLSKPKVLAMTPEIGSSSDGFWPPQSSIIPICQNALVQNLNAALCITKYAIASDQSPYYLSQTNGYISYKIKRLGLDSPATYKVSLIPVSTPISFTGGSVNYPALSMLEEKMDSLPYSLTGTIIPGTKLKYILSVSNGSYTHADTITKVYGTPVTTFFSNGNTMTGWTSPVWGTSNIHYVSAPFSITDSPIGNYPDNADEIITTSSAINLVDAVSARLNFWARWETEPGYDYTEVLVSADNGSTWLPQCGKYTIAGSGNQDPGQPLFNGFQLSWVKEDISLDDYLGQNILLRFELKSDQATNYDGFYFDDLIVKKIINPNGIKEVDGQSTILLFQNIPNPAGEYTFVHYQLPGNEKAEWKLVNPLGQVILEEKLLSSEGDIRIETRDLPAGIYFYRIESDGGASATLKLVVRK